MASIPRANPFYHNYVFDDWDTNRNKISKWQYPLLWFLPTLCQMTDNYVMLYKQWRNKYYVMGFEEWHKKED